MASEAIVAQSGTFEQHYREHYERVYRLALGLTGNPHDAEEISQEAFCRALRAYGSFRGESSFLTWIYRIAVNVASGYLKQRKKMPLETLTEDFGYRTEEILDQDPKSSPEMQYLEREVRTRCLFSLTTCLTGEQRRVFCLAVTLGLPHKQIAEILGCSVGKVKTTLYRARKKWLGYMENHCGMIRKANPCRCGQWVRFAIEKGWITREQADSADPVLDLPALTEISTLRAMTVLCRSVPAADSGALSERIRVGIRKGEWRILSLES